LDEEKEPRIIPGSGDAPDHMAPGTRPIPPGHIRFFHFTRKLDTDDTHPDEKLERIATEGIRLSKATGHKSQEPNAVWAAAGNSKYYPRDGSFVEFSLHHDDPRWAGALNGLWKADKPDGWKEEHSREMERSGDHIAIYHDITPDDIVAVHKSWHEQARSIAEMPDVVKTIQDTDEHDWMKDDPHYSNIYNWIRNNRLRNTNNESVELTVIESEEEPYRTQTFDEVEHGKPVIIHAHHGTTSSIASDIEQSGFRFGKEVERHGFPDATAKVLGRKHLLGDGVYFSDRPRESKKYGPSVLKVEIHLRNPYVIGHGRWSEFKELDPQELQRLGHDGIVVKRGRYGLYRGENYRQGVAFNPSSVRVVKKHAAIGRLAVGAKVRHKQTGESGTVGSGGYQPHSDEHLEWRRSNNRDDGSMGRVHVRWNGSKKAGTKKRSDLNVGDHELELIESRAEFMRLPTATELIEAKLSLPSGVELHPESELSKVIASGRHSHLEADSHDHGYDLTLHPEVNSEVATFTNPDYGGSTRTHYYNPKFADVVTDESLPGYPKKRAVLKTGYSSRLPDSEKNDDQKHLYRGISHEEWLSIKKTGKIKSTGSMNFAGQERSTSYSTDPHAAAHYAAGFAPAYHKPTFNKPAYVVKVRNPGGGTALQGSSTHERDILHDIDASDIVGVYKGEVYHATPLEREVRKPDLMKPRWHEGSASGGDSDVVWSKIK